MVNCELRLGLRGVITKPVVGAKGKYQSAIVCRLSTEIKY
jgi:hypothetical protein